MHPVIAESLCTKAFFRSRVSAILGAGQGSAFFPKQAPKDEDSRMEEIAWLVFQGDIQSAGCGQ